MCSEKKRILIITAVEAEKDAVLQGLHNNKIYDVVAAGVGAVSAAAYTAKLLAEDKYKLVISTGIAGGFGDKAPIGSAVVAEGIIAADLGVDTPGGFLSLEELNYGSTKIESDVNLGNKIVDKLQKAGIVVCSAPIITVSTATGTAVGANIMSGRIPNAGAEAMEGYGAAYAAKLFGIPVIEIRTISNQVGLRDLNKWRINEALNVLEKIFAVLAEEELL